jgi:hypothetical protein
MGELDRLKRRQVAAATAALEKTTDAYLGQASRDAPIDEGTLRAAATRETHVRGWGSSVRVDVVGSFPLVYAEVQETHEEFEHPKGGHAHYLEGAFNQAAPRVDRIVGAAVAAVSGG